MYVGRDDHAAVLACFDETAATVFGVLCQLCAGDADLAVHLLDETYAYLARVASSSYGVDVDRRWMIDAAHSVYAAHARPGRDEGDPIAALAPAERVIVRLHDVERRGPSEIALLIGSTVGDVERSLANGRAVLAPPGSGTSTADAFRRGDVWFDDAMRTRARDRIGGGRVTAPETTGAEEAARADENPSALMSRRTMIGVGAGASIAALIGLGLWFGSSIGNEHADGNELPEPPTTTAPRVRTTTPTTLADDTDTTDDTIVRGTDTTAAETSTTIALADTGFIIDPLPEGWVPAGGGDSGYPPPSWFQLWASADAAHTAGRWLAISVGSFGWGGPQLARPGNRRQIVGGLEALTSTDEDGIINVLAATDPDEEWIDVYAYGLTIDALDAFVGSTTFSRTEAPSFGSEASVTLDGLDLRISRPGGGFGPFPWSASTRGAWYSSPAGDKFIVVEAGPQVTDDLFAIALVEPPSTDPVATVQAPTGIVDVAGRRIVAISLFDQTSLFWHSGAYTIALRSNSSFTELLDLAARTRQATPDEWQAQLEAAPVYTDGPEEPDPTTPPLREIGHGGSSSGTRVFIRMGIADEAAMTVQITHRNGTIEAPYDFDPSHPVTVWIATDVTIIVAVFQSPDPTARLRVSLDAVPAALVALVQLGESEYYAAAYVFDDVADFTVALVDTNGTVIQELDV